MRNNFSLLTHKGRWLLATLTLLFTMGIGQMWGATVWQSDLQETISGVTVTKLNNSDTWATNLKLAWAPGLTKAYQPSGSGRGVQLEFGTSLSLQKGDIIRVFAGGTNNTARTLSLFLNDGGSAVGTVSLPNGTLRVLDYTLGGNLSLSKIKITSNNSAVYIFKVQILSSHPTIGETTVTYEMEYKGMNVQGRTDNCISTISGLSSAFTRNGLNTSTSNGVVSFSGEITNHPTSEDASKNVDLQFTVADGYTFTPSAMSFKWDGNNTSVKAKVTITDGTTSVTSSESTASGSVSVGNAKSFSFASGAFSGKSFSGTVHIKVHIWSSASSKRAYILSPFSITGTVASSASVTTHQVTYALGTGASGTIPTQADVAEGAKFTLHNGTTGITAPANKTFAGWNDGTSTYAGGAEYTMGTSDVTLTAQWADKFTVTYNNNGGTGTMSNTINEIVACTFTAPADKGFKEWNTQADGKGTKYEVGATVTSNLDLYAIWKSVPQTIFDWTAATTNNIEADDTDLSTATYGTLTTGTSVKGRLLGTNTITKNNAGYKLGNNDVCIEIKGTSDFQEGDTVIITATGGGDGERGFAVTPSTSGNPTTDAVVTNLLNGAVAGTCKVVLTSTQAVEKLRVFRHNSKTMYCKTIKVIRPAVRDIASTEITLSDVKVNNASISAANLATLVADHSLTLEGEFAAAPEIKFNEHTVITYGDELLPHTKETDKVYTVTATTSGDNWQAQQTINSVTYTVTAPKVTAAKVYYYDGSTKLGEEIVAINGSPVNAGDYDDKTLASFVGWYNNSDLAEEHKIANIAALVVTADVNVYGKWNPVYATSANLEQWVLVHGTKYNAVAQLGTLHYASNITNSLDSLNDDPSKDNRNYAYLGLKIKASGKMLDFRLANGSTVKVKFGATGNYPQVALNGGSYGAMSLTDNVWTYTADADAYISIKSPNGDTEIFKQIMINEDIAAVTLPWRVTYNANGGTCGTEEAIWSGSALILPDVTPAEPADYSFAGWYDEATGGVLVGAKGASYTPTDNTTLYAHYAPVVYAVNYAAGEHGSGATIIASAGWGTEYTAIENPYTADEGWIFAGWAVTGVDGVNTLADGGSFTMPKNAVVLTAQWEDVSKVAIIVETNEKFETLAAAIAAADDENVQTIQLLQNINQENGVAIAKSLILDLNGKTFTCTSGSNVNSRAIKITDGNVTIKNGSIIAVPTANFEGGAYGPLRIEGATANVTLEDLTLQNGRHYGLGIKLVEGYLRMEDCEVISQNGGGGLEVAGTADVINCTFTQTGLDTQHAWISTCLATCDNGVLNVQGGTYTSEHYSMYVYTSGGEMDVESGSFTGDVVNQVTLSSYPDAVGAINISGGSFEGVGEEPIHFTTDATGKTSIAISGGTFDAPVENQYCAYGYVPSPADPVTGKYSVEPKDGVSLVKITPTSQTKGTQTGLYPDGDELTINLSSGMNLGGSGKYIGVKATENFQEGDVLHLNMSTYQNNQDATAYVYADKDASVFLFDTEEKCDENKDYYITLPAAVNGHKELYIVRTEGNKWNGGPSVMEVTRAMKPMLTAITIDGRDGVIDEANKTVAVQIPYESDLAVLTIVPTIVWNEAAAENSIVVNNGGAWALGANTYKLTDKDNDNTVYTITLTRDVQKHAVKFYDGETLLETLEVEDGTSIADGDVPADPEKEDYIFQGWAETASGDVVDVTSFTISAAKNFYAKWVADGAIKLINKSSGAINTTNFITGVTATEANSEKAAAWGGTQGTSISGVNALGKIVQYNATTNQTKLQIKVYNTNNSDKYVYIHKIIEGNTTEETVETLTATSKTVVTSEYYEFNNTKNRSFYLTTNSTDVKILQVKVIDDGATPMKQAGEAGYSLNLNKGRVVYYANADVTFEGLALNSASNYSVINSTEFQTTKNFSFSISSPVLLKVTTSSAKYYVSQNPNEDGTTATAVTAAGTAEFELTETTNPWYLVPSTTSNVKYTNIAFELPKAETPTITTQPATKLTFDPGDMTATVVAAEPTDGGTLSYQWYNAANDEEVEGATEATLTTTTEGTYYVVVTNTLAGHQDVSVTSEEAELGYRVTNDATLMALSYGGTAITLEDGVYNYNVELAKGTTDVPALAATATMDGYATVIIADAAEFVNYEASSTVTVKSEDETETLVYTVNFYVKHDLPQVDVTATTTWDMTNVSASAIDLSKAPYSCQNDRLLLANIDGVNNNASFNSQALMFEGQHIGRTGDGVKHLAGRYVQFNVTVPGAVFVTFESNGDNARTISINGKKCARTTSGTSAEDYITYALAVEPGSVEIVGYQGTSANQYVRISKIEFKAEASHTRSNVNPSYLGTLCWTNNAILGGGTLYELAGKNTFNYLVFDEVAENRLEAGKPYIFMPENGNTEIKLYNTDTEEPLTTDQDPVNNMYGTITGKTLNHIDDADLYYFSSNHIWHVGDFNIDITIPAYYCYVDYPAVLAGEPAAAPAPGRRRVTMGVQGEQVATGLENLKASDKPMKLIIDGQIFILRGEKMYDATGRLVK